MVSQHLAMQFTDGFQEWAVLLNGEQFDAELIVLPLSYLE